MDALADKLLISYNLAEPSSIEDDVSLCVWVRDLTGEELTLQQAEELRGKLDHLLETTELTLSET